MRGTLFGLTSLAVCFSFSASAGETLTKADIEAVLVGNTRCMQVRSAVSASSGTLCYYHAQDGVMHARNTFKESGQAKYTIEDDGKLCLSWDFKIPNSLASDGCWVVAREGEKVLSVGGRNWSLEKGDARP